MVMVVVAYPLLAAPMGGGGRDSIKWGVGVRGSKMLRGMFAFLFIPPIPILIPIIVVITFPFAVGLILVILRCLP